MFDLFELSRAANRLPPISSSIRPANRLPPINGKKNVTSKDTKFMELNNDVIEHIITKVIDSEKEPDSKYGAIINLIYTCKDFKILAKTKIEETTRLLLIQNIEIILNFIYESYSDFDEDVLLNLYFKENNQIKEIIYRQGPYRENLYITIPDKDETEKTLNDIKISINEYISSHELTFLTLKCSDVEFLDIFYTNTLIFDKNIINTVDIDLKNRYDEAKINYINYKQANKKKIDVINYIHFTIFQFRHIIEVALNNEKYGVINRKWFYVYSLENYINYKLKHDINDFNFGKNIDITEIIKEIKKSKKHIDKYDISKLISEEFYRNFAISTGQNDINFVVENLPYLKYVLTYFNIIENNNKIVENIYNILDNNNNLYTYLEKLSGILENNDNLYTYLGQLSKILEEKQSKILAEKKFLRQNFTNIRQQIAHAIFEKYNPPISNGAGKKKLSKKTKTDQTIIYKEKKRVIYIGSRGGKYIKKNKQYLRVK